MSGPFLFWLLIVMYPHITNDPIIIVVIIMLSFIPVFIPIIIVASDMYPFVFVSLYPSFSPLSNLTLFVPSPRFSSPFTHFNSIVRFFVSFTFKFISVSSFPSGLFVHPSDTISYPFGISSTIFSFIVSSPLFSIFILYSTITLLLFICAFFNSSFVNPLFVIFISFPSNFMLFIVFSISMFSLVLSFISCIPLMS